MQTKKNEQQTRRQSRVHFQTPEANVVSEAADPDQDERNNSSKAGSTPFQAKLRRRVSFAAQDEAAEQTNVVSAAEQVSAAAAGVEAGHSLTARCLDDSIAEPSHTAVTASEAETDTDQGITSAFTPVTAKTISPKVAAEAVADEEADDSYSDGTVSAAAGSTPYLNRRMLSAALQASTADSHLDEDPEEGSDKKAGGALSSMMARLLSEEWCSQDELAGHDQVRQPLHHARKHMCFFCLTCQLFGVASSVCLCYIVSTAILFDLCLRIAD